MSFSCLGMALSVYFRPSLKMLFDRIFINFSFKNSRATKFATCILYIIPTLPVSLTSYIGEPHRYTLSYLKLSRHNRLNPLIDYMHE